MFVFLNNKIFSDFYLSTQIKKHLTALIFYTHCRRNYKRNI